MRINFQQVCSMTTCNSLVVNKLSQVMRTHPDIGLLITSLLQNVNSLVETCIFIFWLCCSTQLRLFFSSKFQPKVVTDLDEADLAKELEKLERQNQEVDGDDDNPDDEDEQDQP